MLSTKRTTEPSTEPVTEEQLEDYLRGDGNMVANEGSLLTDLIVSAREYVEQYTKRGLITQSWTMYMNSWISGVDDLGWWDGVKEGPITGSGDNNFVELPMAPLQSITSVKTFASDNSSTTFASTNYFEDTNSTPGRLILNTGSTWPSFTRNQNGIEIVYVVGYGDEATDVPSALRTAIKMLAVHWYENREMVKTQSDQNQAMAPLHVMSILNRYRVVRL